MNDLFTIDFGEILLREFRIEDVDAIYELTSQLGRFPFIRKGSFSVIEPII